MIKKVKDFWYSTAGTIIISTLTAMFISPVTVFTYIGAIVIVLIVGMIFIFQITQEHEEDYEEIIKTTQGE